MTYHVLIHHSTDPKIRRSLIAVAVINIVVNIPQALLVWFQCSPVDALWDPAQQAQCDHRKSVYYTYFVGAVAAVIVAVAVEGSGDALVVRAAELTALAGADVASRGGVLVDRSIAAVVLSVTDPEGGDAASTAGALEEPGSAVTDGAVGRLV